MEISKLINRCIIKCNNNFKYYWQRKLYVNIIIYFESFFLKVFLTAKVQIPYLFNILFFIYIVEELSMMDFIPLQ